MVMIADAIPSATDTILPNEDSRRNERANSPYKQNDTLPGRYVALPVTLRGVSYQRCTTE